MNMLTPAQSAVAKVSLPMTNVLNDQDFQTRLPARFSSISAPEDFPLLPDDLGSISTPRSIGIEDEASEEINSIEVSDDFEE